MHPSAGRRTRIFGLQCAQPDQCIHRQESPVFTLGLHPLRWNSPSGHASMLVAAESGSYRPNADLARQGGKACRLQVYGRDTRRRRR